MIHSSPRHQLSRPTSHSCVLFSAVNVAIISQVSTPGGVPGEEGGSRTQAALLTATAHGPSGEKQVIWANPGPEVSENGARLTCSGRPSPLLGEGEAAAGQRKGWSPRGGRPGFCFSAQRGLAACDRPALFCQWSNGKKLPTWTCPDHRRTWEGVSEIVWPGGF